MNLTEDGISLIKKYEGLRLKAYKCPAGILTIGYGHTEGVEEGTQITEEEADKMLQKDLEAFCKGVRDAVEVQLTDSQFSALVSFAFNLGVHALKRSSLLRYLNEKAYQLAADEFPKWVYAGGKKLPGLVKRRVEEREMFLKDMEKGLL